LIAVLAPGEADEICALHLRRPAWARQNSRQLERIHALTLRAGRRCAGTFHEFVDLAAQAVRATVITNDGLFHVPARPHPAGRRHLHRHNSRSTKSGFRRERHADRTFKPPRAIWRACFAASEALVPYDRGIAQRWPFLIGTNWPTNIRQESHYTGRRRSRYGDAHLGSAAKRIPMECRQRVAGGPKPMDLSMAAADRRTHANTYAYTYFSDGAFNRPLCPLEQRHSLPGTRLGRTPRYMLRSRKHLIDQECNRPAFGGFVARQGAP